MNFPAATMVVWVVASGGCDMGVWRHERERMKDSVKQ